MTLVNEVLRLALQSQQNETAKELRSLSMKKKDLVYPTLSKKVAQSSSIQRRNTREMNVGYLYFKNIKCI